MAPIEVSNPAGSAGLPQGRLTVSVLTATAIVVADMVGVGVFTSLGFQVQGIPSGFSLLLLWVVGGVVALCGVFSYGELAAMFPRSSGEYNFLRQSWHPALRRAGGLAVGHGRLRGPDCTRRHGVRRIREGDRAWTSAGCTGLAVSGSVASSDLRGIRHSSAFQISGPC